MSRRRFLHMSAGAAAAAPFVSALGACRPVDPDNPGFTSPFAGAKPVSHGPGSWCWFSTRRTVIDGRGRLHVGHVVTGTGTAGDGDIIVSSLNLASGRIVGRQVVGRTTEPDDHANPALLLPQGPNGPVNVAWAPHSLRPENSQLWSGQLGQPLKPVHKAGGIAYASTHMVNGEQWMLSRFNDPIPGHVVGYSWCLLRNDGSGWRIEGTTILPVPDTGGRPYHMACTDGRRLHVFASDAHPARPYGSSIRHFCIEADMSITDGRGRTFGRIGTNPPRVDSLPAVWNGGTDSNGETPSGWPVDAAWINDRPNALISYRGKSTWPGGKPRAGLDTENAYAWTRRRSNGAWDTQRIAHAGSNLVAAQPNYTGLATLDPTDPFSVVISTNTHPVTSAPLRSAADGVAHWELWAGKRGSDRHWRWAPITKDSRLDNLRPDLATNGRGMMALTYMSGTYPDYYRPDTEILTRSYAL